MLQSSKKNFAATASTVTEFLPVLDQLEALRETYYCDDPFGKQYIAVTGTMKTALTASGVSDYTISVGDMIDMNSSLILLPFINYRIDLIHMLIDFILD